MSKIPPLIIEIKDALKYLRRASHKGRFTRAANRLEKLSQDILNPQPKVKKPKAQNARLIGGSGRQFPIKIALPEDTE